MVTTARDLIFVGAANHAEADTGTQGGAKASGVRVVFRGLELSALGTLTLNVDVSATVTYRVTGRDFEGAVQTEDFAWTAASGDKVGTQAFLSILKIVKQSGTLPAAATMQARETSTNLARAYLFGSSKTVQNPSGVEETEVRRLLIGAAIPGTGTSTFYEKLFLLNAGASTLSSAEIRKTADPEGIVEFALDSAVDGTTTSTNRVTAPASGVGSFGHDDVAIPGGNLATGEAIGVWLKFTVASTERARRGALNLQVRGEGL